MSELQENKKILALNIRSINSILSMSMLQLIRVTIDGSPSKPIMFKTEQEIAKFLESKFSKIRSIDDPLDSSTIDHEMVIIQGTTPKVEAKVEVKLELDNSEEKKTSTIDPVVAEKKKLAPEVDLKPEVLLEATVMTAEPVVPEVITVKPELVEEELIIEGYTQDKKSFKPNGFVLLKPATINDKFTKSEVPAEMKEIGTFLAQHKSGLPTYRILQSEFNIEKAIKLWPATHGIQLEIMKINKVTACDSYSSSQSPPEMLPSWIEKRIIVKKIPGGWFASATKSIEVVIVAKWFVSEFKLPSWYTPQRLGEMVIAKRYQYSATFGLVVDSNDISAQVLAFYGQHSGAEWFHLDDINMDICPYNCFTRY